MLMLSFIFEILISLINVIEYLLIGYIILGWFVFFGVIKNRNGIFSKVYVFLMSKIEPMLTCIRKILPSVAGLDFSPLVVFVALHFAKILLIRLFFMLAYG